jgi:methionyl-tRNA synthetase
VADAPEKGVGPSDRSTKSAKKVIFSRKMVQMDAGDGEAAKWKKKSEALFRLDNLQEEARNHVSSAMAAFVQRTSLVKEVHTPSSPRAPWQISRFNPLWGFKSDFCKFFE